MTFLVEPKLYFSKCFSICGPCDKYVAPCDCDAVREICGADLGV